MEARRNGFRIVEIYLDRSLDQGKPHAFQSGRLGKLTSVVDPDLVAHGHGMQLGDGNRVPNRHAGAPVLRVRKDTR
ncbi:MAG: hypothetical protein F4101_03595 [Nitrospira sp. SB0673_bin_12]|nr:hypothetical protein [Nitrospira sp. SB0673_bin_12]